MARIDPDEYLAVGRIRGAHGIRGEVKVEVMTDFPERFAAGSKLLVEGEEDGREVVSTRKHKDMLLLKMAGWDSRSAAEVFRGRHLLIPRSAAAILPEDVFYEDQLLGLQVRTGEGVDLGELADVWWMPANEVYVVQGTYGEVLLPAISEVVQRVDLQMGEMVVKLLPGLIPALDEIEKQRVE